MLREETLEAELQSIDIVNKKAKLVTVTNIIKDDVVIHSIYDYEDVTLDNAVADIEALCVKLKAQKESAKKEEII